MNAQIQMMSAPVTRPTNKAKRPRVCAASLADRLEWVAVVVLPLASLVAAVSLLSHAIR